MPIKLLAPGIMRSICKFEYAIVHKKDGAQLKGLHDYEVMKTGGCRNTADIDPVIYGIAIARHKRAEERDDCPEYRFSRGKVNLERQVDILRDVFTLHA